MEPLQLLPVIISIKERPADDDDDDASCCWWVWVNETHSVHLCRKELHWFLLKEEGNWHSLSLCKANCTFVNLSGKVV
jgi:hypothetical protein